MQERRPVEIDFALFAVAGDEDAGLRVIAMGEGNAGIGCGSGGCGSGGSCGGTAGASAGALAEAPILIPQTSQKSLLADVWPAGQVGIPFPASSGPAGPWAGWSPACPDLCLPVMCVPVLLVC